MHAPNQSLMISLLKVFIFIVPLLLLFSQFASQLVWWGFVIAEFLTTISSFFMFIYIYNKKIKVIP